MAEVYAFRGRTYERGGASHTSRKFTIWHRNILNRAKKQGVPDSLSGGRFLAELWDYQEGKCAVSGIEFLPLVNDDVGNAWNKATVDRIIPELGYVPGNVRLVLYYVNDMKGHRSDALFNHVIDAIVAKRSK